MKRGVIAIATLVVGISVGFAARHFLWPQISSSANTQAPRGLYTDDEVRRIVDRWSAHDAEDEDILSLVPNGSTAPLITVFGAIGVDPSRLGKPKEGGLNMVTFLTWQLSPSYQLSFMTAVNDPDNEGVELVDAKRKVYGIRITDISKYP